MIDLAWTAATAAALTAALWRLFGRPPPSRLLAIALFSAIVAGIGVWKLSSARAAILGPTVLRVATERPQVALTFDDGPSAEYTMAVLDLLGDARSTFFVVGAELEAHPELGEAIRARGHELANHSYSHERMIFRSGTWLRDELDRTDAAIRAAGHQGPIAFRPPYGKRLWGLHRALGPRPAVLWDIEPESWAEVAHTPEGIAAHVLERVRPGSIVLMHLMYRSRETSRAALPLVLEGLAARGLEPVPLSELDAARSR